MKTNPTLLTTNKPCILFQFSYLTISCDFDLLLSFDMIWFGIQQYKIITIFYFQRITLGLPNKMIGIRQYIFDCVSMHARLCHGKEKSIPAWQCSDFRLCNPAIISWNKYGHGPMHMSNEIMQPFLDFHIIYWDITSCPKLLGFIYFSFFLIEGAYFVLDVPNYSK